MAAECHHSVQGLRKVKACKLSFITSVRDQLDSTDMGGAKNIISLHLTKTTADNKQ